jgi:hypothetical protein
VAVPYKIAVAIAMSSNHNAVLAALSANLLGVHTKVNQLHGGFNRLKLAIGGAFAVTAGMALFGVMDKLIDKTKDYQDQLIKLKALGGDMTPAVQNGSITAKAFDIAKRVPMSVTDLAKIPGMSYSILGQEDSMKVWEDLAKFQTVMQFQEHKSPEAASGELQKWLRAGELGGRLTDPNTHQVALEEVRRFMDLSQKIMASTHGMVNPSTLLGMSQQAGFSMRGMSDEGFMNMAIAAQAMGGPRAGTALLSTYQQMGGGRMTRQAAQNMQDMGMLNEGDWSTDHGKVIVNAETQRRLGRLVSENPMNLVNEMLSNLEKRGVTDPVEQNRLVMGALGRQTSQRFVAEQMMNKHQIDAERGRMGQGMAQGTMFDTIMNESVSKNLEGMKAAWENLLIAVAGPNSGNVVAMLKAITGGLNSMTDAIRGMNPDTLRLIGAGLATLSLALVGGGAVALLAALGPAGWIILGATAVATGMNLLSQVDWKGLATSGWEKIASVFETIKNAIMDFIGFIASIPGKLGGLLGGGKGGEFGKDLGDANKSYVPMKFSPGQKTMTAQPIQISMNVDGRSLGQAVSEQLLYLATFSGSAPAADGRSFPTGGDHNFSST